MTVEEQSQDPNDDSSDSSPDDVREDVIKRAWSDMYQTSDHLLFGSRETDVDLLTLHPEQVQIFRLWQIYIDNVNPLLKVIHIPTLQGRIIDAASNMSNIKPTSAALMFSIYCVAILSLSEDECRSIFGLPRENLLTKYQFGCQQALRNCAFLRSNDRDCLTAMYLYLVSQPGCPYHRPDNARFQLDLVQIPRHYPPCWALPCALRSVWGSTGSQPMLSVLLSRLKCVGDFGGRSFYSILACAS